MRGVGSTARAARAAGRWLIDWRTGLTFLASIVVALLLVVVITGARTTQAALAARQDIAERATRRIDLQNQKISELIALSQSSAEKIGALSDQVAVMQEQVRQLGGVPIVKEVIVPVPVPVPTSTTVPPAGSGAGSSRQNDHKQNDQKQNK